MFGADPTYLLCVMLPGILLSLAVQLYLKSTFGKWSRVANGANVTGKQTTDVLFSRTSLSAIPVEPTQGSLTDHFDPQKGIVRLSEPVYGQRSVSAMAVSAHELGHVQQYQTGSGLIKARGFLLPAIQFSPTLSYMSILMGIIFNITGLIWLGVFFFGLLVLFSILTLPVELDASRRAIGMLEESGLIVSDQDKAGAKAVLRAAAMTYLAAAVTSLLQLFYYMSLASRRR
ncbi:MAG: zinc metallopeptidase [Candidatus Promineifilaceae bacterium]|jgi:Zn-dependent membrane protease YugP